jgi:purine-nucleoside phosphorylase
MAYSFSGLVAYVEQNERLLVASSVLGAKTQQLIQQSGNVMVGVKSKETINIMDADAIFQAGGTCGFLTSGTTTFSQREVEVGKFKVNEAICPKDLEAYYTQKALPNGSRYDATAFAEEYTSRKAAKIAAQLEKAIWQGDKTSVDVNLNKFDGIIELVKDAGASVINANAAAFYTGAPATAIDNSTVVNVFDAVYKAIPAEIIDKDDVKIFCGMDVFRTLTVKIKNENYFHYQTEARPQTSFFLPGTTIEVVGTPGLNGTNKIYAMRVSNLFLGVDLLNEGTDRWELFYAREADQVRFVSEFKMGVNFAFPTEVVKFEI